VRWVGNDRHFVFRQKLLGEDGSVRWGVFTVKQPGLFSPKFGATSSHVFTHSWHNVALEPGIHTLAFWYRCFALQQLLYRWRHQFGIFWIPSLCYFLSVLYKLRTRKWSWQYLSWSTNSLNFFLNRKPNSSTCKYMLLVVSRTLLHGISKYLFSPIFKTLGNLKIST
jgi:hypothetical protein